MRADWQTGRQASVFATVRINSKIYPSNMPKGDRSLVSIFFWADWASGHDALRVEVTAILPIRLLTDY